MQLPALDDGQVHSLLHVMASQGVENAAAGLSQMIGHRVRVSLPSVSLVSISSLPERVGGAEALAVGIYMACEGELGGHIMLMMEYENALHLTDLLLGQPEGTTQELDALARSALGEAGNLAASFFLNAVAGSVGIAGRPSPPAVIVDMAGAILDMMLVTAGALGDDILMFEAVFEEEDRQLTLQFWMVPDLEPLCSMLYATDRSRG